MPIRALTKKLQEIANTELNEDPARVEEYIEDIREWLTKQPHLQVRTDDQWLLNFLRCSKFSLQRTKERLDYFYTMRTLVPEAFKNRDPLLPAIQDILKVGFVLVLPKPVEEHGPIIMMLRWKGADPEKHPVWELYKVFLMMTDILLMESDNLSVSGLVLIQDDEKYPKGYLLQNTPTVAKKQMLVNQNAYPIRLKAACFINFSSALEAAYNLFKRFISAKIKDRIKLYGKSNTEELFKTVPKTLLPKEYGGDAGSVEEITAACKTKMESYRDWFLQDARYFSDETKRPGKPITSSDVFGVEGSFKKLNVD